MKNKNLKAGLIMSVVASAIAVFLLFLATIFSKAIVDEFLKTIDPNITATAGTAVIAVLILMLLTAVAGLIISCVALSKAGKYTPEEQNSHKGLAITTFVFTCLGALTFLFSLETFLLGALFVLASIFTMIGICTTKKYLEQETKESKDEE